MKSIAIALLLLSLITVCYGSSGDLQPEFIECVRKCSLNKENTELPFYLKMLGWNVKQDCQYHCMQRIANYSIEHGQQVHQYYGKWPFYRIFGIQEPASVLFSVLNGWMHFKYFRILKRQIGRGYFLKKYYIGMSLFGMNAWLWSSVFHTRDTSWTEKMDYLSAGLYILYGLYIAILRIFYLRENPAWLWTLVCSLLYLAHLSYLLRLDRFDYEYNMKVCLIVGGLQTSLWLTWSIIQYTKYGKPQRRSFAWMAGLSVVLIAFAMSLEVFDFPPLKGILDAHSLWHAATIPLSPLFYKFLLRDTEFEYSSSRTLFLRP